MPNYDDGTSLWGQQQQNQQPQQPNQQQNNQQQVQQQQVTSQSTLFNRTHRNIQIIDRFVHFILASQQQQQVPLPQNRLPVYKGKLK